MKNLELILHSSSKHNFLSKYIIMNFYYIFLSIILVIILFILLNYQHIKHVIERQGLADENSDYIYPEVIHYFISEKQNREILEYASNLFTPSVVGGGIKNVVDSNIRKSQTAWITKDNPIVKEIYEKICNKYNLNIENAEDMQVVKYEKDNFYREHHDSFPFYEPDFLSQGGHRILTTLIYLNDDFQGGETRFVTLDKNIKPIRNSAIIFHPLEKTNKRCHPKALHAGMPIKSGVKYVCNIWFRETPYKYEINTRSYEYLFNSCLLFIYRSCFI